MNKKIATTYADDIWDFSKPGKNIFQTDIQLIYPPWHVTKECQDLRGVLYIDKGRGKRHIGFGPLHPLADNLSCFEIGTSQLSG